VSVVRHFLCHSFYFCDFCNFCLHRNVCSLYIRYNSQHIDLVVFIALFEKPSLPRILVGCSQSVLSERDHGNSTLASARKHRTSCNDLQPATIRRVQPEQGLARISGIVYIMNKAKHLQTLACKLFGRQLAGRGSGRVAVAHTPFDASLAFTWQSDFYHILT